MEQKSFFQALFDLSFTDFITLRLVPVLYVISIIVAVIIALVIIIGGFAKGIGSGIIALIIGPVVFVLNLIVARVWMEMIMVVFRISDYTRQIAQKE